MTPFDKVKVVILAQDPFPNPFHAHGLAFSIPKDENNIPRSLRNIKKELKEDLNMEFSGGNLEGWAQQGVLLLNTTLTVEQGESNSHKDIGWGKLTDEIIQKISDRRNRVVFILWGGNAKEKAPLIDDDKHLVLKGAHPVARAGQFFGNKHFSKTNDYLAKSGKQPIVWSQNE